MSVKGFNVNGVIEKYDYNELDNKPSSGGTWVATVTDETIEVLDLELLTNVSEVGY